MGFKRFGKLAGNTNASASVAENAAANTLTPYAAQPGGTKFLAWGEGASSLAFNRALSALQENIEHAHGALDAPALAETRITAGDAASGAQTFGTRALFNVADSATSINLATLSNTGNVGLAPIFWVYTGLHQDQLRKFIRGYRFTSNSVNGPIDAFAAFNPSGALDARTANMVAPDDVLTKAAGTSIFIDPVTGLPQGYASSTIVSQQTLAQYIPPIKYVDSDLPPYSGASVTDTVSQWWNDGASLSTFTWRELYMRPGCFAHVTGAGPNNGLYRVAEVKNIFATASDKAILTRGGLHKVKVASALPFRAGRLLAWAPAPFGGIDPPTTAILNNFAYLVFRDTAENVLYLADLPGEEDFGTQGAATQWGQKIDNTGTVPASVENIGTVGQIDLEVGAGSSSKLLVGQYIFDAGDLTKKTTVVSITQSNTPVQFDTTQTGSVTPCNPLGFTLNPVLTFPSGALQKGNYLIQCKRLSTVRENLTTPGSTAQYKIIPNAADTLNYSEFEAGLVRAFTKYIKTGEESATTRGAGSEYVSGPFTASNMILGDGLWKVVFTPSGPNLDTVVTLNTPVQIYTSGGAPTVGVIQSVTTNTAIITDVTTDGWADTYRAPTISQDPIQIGSVLTIGGNTFTVSTISYKPSVRYVSYGGTVTSVTPGFGLDAAYNSQYVASKYGRRPGSGNFIRMSGGFPVTIILPTTGGFTSGNIGLQINSTNNLAQTALKLLGPASNIELGMSASGAMVVKDTNIGTAIPVSSALHTTLNPPYGGSLTSNILGSITEQSGPFLAARGAISGNGRVGAELIVAPSLEMPAGTPVVFGTLTAGTTVVVSSGGVGYYNGYYYEIPGQSVAVPLGISQLIWDGSAALGSQYKFITGEPAVYHATVAAVNRVLGNCTFFSTSVLTKHKNKKESVLTVGSTGGMFTTIADAVDTIAGLTTLGVGTATRTYIIEVRGSTTETRTTSFSANGIVIRGASGTNATVSWGVGFNTLFDINGKEDISIRDLTLKYDSAAAGASSVRYVFWNNTAGAKNILINNIKTRAAQDRLSNYGYFSNTTNLKIHDCYLDGSTDFGLSFASCTDLQIRGCTLIRTGTNQAVVSNAHYGIKLDTGCSRVVVTDCVVKDFYYTGIWAAASDRLVLRNCIVKGLSAGATSPIAFYILAAATQVVVDGCLVDSVTGLTPSVSGFVCGADKSKIVNSSVIGMSGAIVYGYLISANKALVHGNSYEAGTFVTSETAITISGNNCIVDANQTGGMTGAGQTAINVTGLNNSIGAMNRDDA